MIFLHFAESNSSLLSSKIVGGLNTDLVHKKFMASLRIRQKHYCCGFLISKKIVLSSGFCACYMISYSRPRFFDASAFVGEIDLTKIKSGKIIDVDRANYHENYNPEDPITTGDYDIGYILVSLLINFHFVKNCIAY